MTLAIDRNDPALRAHAETYRQAASAKAYLVALNKLIARGGRLHAQAAE